MRRRFINFLTVVSLALFIAVAILWVRSYFFRDSLVWKRVDNSVIKDRALFFGDAASASHFNPLGSLGTTTSEF